MQDPNWALSMSQTDQKLTILYEVCFHTHGSAYGTLISAIPGHYTLPNLSPLYLYRQVDSVFEESWVE